MALSGRVAPSPIRRDRPQRPVLALYERALRLVRGAERRGAGLEGPTGRTARRSRPGASSSLLRFAPRWELSFLSWSYEVRGAERRGAGLETGVPSRTGR